MASATFANGLRLLVLQQPQRRATAACLSYDSGTRDEGPGECGFAHLTEHLTYDDGSGGAAHAQVVEGLGGVLNARTHADRTSYWSHVPNTALRTILALEARRLQPLHLSAERLAREKRIVAAEVRGRHPHVSEAAFPHAQLSTLLFRNGANSHRGFTELDDVIGSDVDAVAAFHERCYRPDRAVVVIVSPLDPDLVTDAVDQTLGRLPGRTRSANAGRDRTIDGTGDPVATLAEVPLCQIGLATPLPDLVGRPEIAAGLELLGRVLPEVVGPGPGPADELLSVQGRPALLGGPLTTRAPNGFVVQCVGDPAVDDEAVEDRVRAAVRSIAAGQADPSRVEARATGVRRGLLDLVDDAAELASTLGGILAVGGRPTALNEAVDALADDPSTILQRAAETLTGPWVRATRRPSAVAA